MILNTSEAALHLGYRSRTTLQRLLRDGLLNDYRAGHRGRAVLLETAPAGLPTLRETVQTLTQYRPGSPLWQQQRRRPAALPLAELSDDALAAAMAPIDDWLKARERAPRWDAVAQRLNDYLGDGWPGPPYDGDQAATLALCLEMAQEAAAVRGVA